MNKLQKLRRFNIIMGVFHLIQGGFMLTVSLTVDKVKNFKPVIQSNYLMFDPERMTLVSNNERVFDLPFGILVASFLLMSAVAHFIIASPTFNDKYNEDLLKGINKFRWFEYMISSSVMLVLIATLFGIFDIGALILIFGINAVMNLGGYLMEELNQYTEKVVWTPFTVGTIAGLVPWIVIVMYAFGNADPSEVPWFVYAIIGSYFVFFNLFPINMILQYKQVGKWKDYLYGERTYIVLSLVSKSLLAWLVFSGVMQP